MTIRTKAVLIYAGLLISPHGWADQTSEQELDDIFKLSLEQLLDIEVKTATKTPEKSRLSAASMTVITDADISNYGYQSVAEVLQHVAGFVDNDDLAIHNFGVRGINSGARSGSRTLKFMIDGQAIAFRATSQNFIDSELIPIDLVERIEIVRGPVSALYGANAFLGVVNVVSKKGNKLKYQGSALRLEGSAIDAAKQGYHVSLTAGDATEGFNYRLGFSTGKEDRTGIDLPRVSPDFEHFDAKQSLHDVNRPLSVYFKSDYQLDDEQNLAFALHYQQLDVDNPFSDINALQLTGHSHIGLENLFARLDYRLELNNTTNAHFFAAYTRGDTLNNDRVEVGAERFFLDRRIGHEGIDLGAELFINFRHNDIFLMGLDFKHDEQKLESFSRVDRQTFERTVLNANRDDGLSDLGAYLQYIAQFDEHWKGILGYRHDDDSVIGRQNSYRIGVVGQLPYDVVLKVLAGSAFQAPSPELLYRDGVQSGDIIGNPDLDAQKSSTVELSVSFPIGDYVHLTTTYFDSTVDDLVVFESDSTNLFAKNSVKSESKGIELEGRILYQGFNAYFNYMRQDTQREQDPFSLFVLEYRQNGALFPEQTANFGVSYRWSDMQLSWQTRWVDKRPASTQNVLIANQFYQIDDYTTSNLSIATNAFSLLEGKEATLRFQVRDIFDNRHVDPGFGGLDFPSLGRRFSIGFEQRF